MPVDPELQGQRRKALAEILAALPVRKTVEIVCALRKIDFKEVL